MSDPTRSDVSHYDNLEHWGPISAERMIRLGAMLRLGPGDRVLDVGCGKATFLAHLAARYGAHTIGLDRSPHALALARETFAQRAPEASPTWIQADAAEQSFEHAQLDAIVWNGGPYVAFKGIHDTLRMMKTWLKPGGTLLVGHGFWIQPPPEDYLDATGIPSDEFTDHAGNIACGQAAGLIPLYCCISNRDEWDHFESTIHYNTERRALDRPDDPPARLERRRAWFMAQQRWGRETMGFGLYLFAAPTS